MAQKVSGGVCQRMALMAYMYGLGSLAVCKEGCNYNFESRIVLSIRSAVRWEDKAAVGTQKRPMDTLIEESLQGDFQHSRLQMLEQRVHAMFSICMYLVVQFNFIKAKSEHVLFVDSGGSDAQARELYQRLMETAAVKLFSS
ncbi:hypothetical protein HYFRA_00001687 [Hymenoscyphus fraxineus]|uniref:Uncharacterized protein n=1 Tax=Hymenoscyphus fraxineus TaxID=746836 RepID=A0A9N9PXW8_9HELO|nr:hypothetical protein HYFRA_00001687 [Hymenoscyphus fraxineus]